MLVVIACGCLFALFAVSLILYIIGAFTCCQRRRVVKRTIAPVTVRQAPSGVSTGAEQLDPQHVAHLSSRGEFLAAQQPTQSGAGQFDATAFAYYKKAGPRLAPLPNTRHTPGQPQLQAAQPLPAVQRS